MIRHSTQRIRLLNLGYLRWTIAIATGPFIWWACTSHPLTQPIPAPQQETDLKISVAPVRELDMVFMIDNSPSMAPKQDKLRLQFPNLINALKDPSTGSLPDLRVAIIDSDLGTDGAWSSGTCGPNAENGNGLYGDQGKFRMTNAASCGVTDPNALWLEYKGGAAQNFTPPAGGDIGTVFACLAGGLGTLGCGEEHQLEAFEFALVPVGGIGNDGQHAMIRPEAYLGLVFLTDEDDCSAAGNDGMFGDKPGGSDLSAESASLRCSTRAYTCKGTGNLSDGTGSPTAPGYPSTTSFQAAWADCSPRTDYCPNPVFGGKTSVDVSKPTSCTPLRDLTQMADEIKGLKSDPDQILVAGIFGWPVGGDFTKAEPVKFAPRPNPNTTDTAHPTLLDYWSLCYDPNHLPTKLDPETGNDVTAWGWGAGPGLREAAFIDEFGANGLKFSICEADYTDALTQIGATLAARLQNLCVNYKLWTNPATGQPDCRVAYSVPGTDPQNANSIVYAESPNSLPECDPSYSVSNPPPDSFGDCWMLTTGSSKCPNAYNGQLITVLRTAKEIAAGPLTAGTKVDMECSTCTDFLDQNGKPLPGC